MPREVLSFLNTFGADRLDDLANLLVDKFRKSQQSRAEQIESHYQRWIDNYNAKPREAVRTIPFYRASNFVPPLARMHTDILTARTVGLFVSAKPFWKVTSKRHNFPSEYWQDLNEFLEVKCWYDIGLFNPLYLGIHGAFRTGTQVFKGPWTYRDFCLVGGMDDAGRAPRIEMKEFEELRIQPVSFEDFWVYPVTVTEEEDVQIKFHRLRMTKEEVVRRQGKLWEKGACEELLRAPENTEGPQQDQKARDAGISLTQDVIRPYTAIEAWLEFPFDPGKNIRICVTFNPKSAGRKALLRGVFNAYSTGIDPFIKMCLIPREGNWYGYSIPHLVEQAQEEKAQIHNSRRDASTVGNIPSWKKKKGVDVPNPSAEWYPGKVFELEDMGDLEFMGTQTSYNHMMEEEKEVDHEAEQVTGVSPPMQGFGAGFLQGKRGIYNSGGTLALLAEGNRRLDIYVKLARDPMHRLGNLIYQSYRDFSNLDQELEPWDPAKQKRLRELFAVKQVPGKKSLYFEIGASDASANREVDRTSLLLMSNTMAAYYQRVIEAAGMVAQMPAQHPLRPLVLEVLSGARDLANRLLFAFDIGDRDRLLPDAAKVLGGGQPGQPGAPNASSMPQPEGDVSIGQLQDVSQLLAQISGKVDQGTNGGRGTPGTL